MLGQATAAEAASAEWGGGGVADSHRTGGLERHGEPATLSDLDTQARVAELADALSSGGSSGNGVQVRILSRALAPSPGLFFAADHAGDAGGWPPNLHFQADSSKSIQTDRQPVRLSC